MKCEGRLLSFEWFCTSHYFEAGGNQLGNSALANTVHETEYDFHVFRPLVNTDAVSGYLLSHFVYASCPNLVF